MHVAKVGTGMLVPAPALPLPCCVILGKFLLLCGPESPVCSFQPLEVIYLAQKSVAQNP